MSADQPPPDLDAFRTALAEHAIHASYAELDETIVALARALEQRTGSFSGFITASVHGVRAAIARAANVPVPMPETVTPIPRPGPFGDR